MKPLAQIFKALGDESRLRILNILFRSGELCVCDIERIMGFTQTKVSRHLGYLKRAGLVDDRRQGVWMLYRIAAPKDADHKQILELVQQLLLSDAEANCDADELRQSISRGCCTTFNVLKPNTAPGELTLH